MFLVPRMCYVPFCLQKILNARSSGCFSLHKAPVFPPSHPTDCLRLRKEGCWLSLFVFSFSFLHSNTPLCMKMEVYTGKRKYFELLFVCPAMSRFFFILENNTQGNKGRASNVTFKVNLKKMLT